VRSILFEAPTRVTLAEVARRHGLSARSLQRRLEQEGLSWRDLVDEVRRSEYERLRGALTQAELAERLGFADAAALRKARRRWERSLRDELPQDASGE
jgi:AraC-like DNA-binding protein